MATAITSFLGGAYGNSTLSNAVTSCAPCNWFRLFPKFADWSSNATDPVLVTRQNISDPIANTRSEFVTCDNSALNALQTDPYRQYAFNNRCDLVVHFGGATEYGATVTLTGSTGHYVELPKTINVFGEISTTDANGMPTCLSNPEIVFSTPIGIYSGRFTTGLTVPFFRKDTWSIDSAGEVVNTTYLYSSTTTGLWSLPDLTDYISGVAAFTQCPYVSSFGTPYALTLANELILPESTIGQPSGTEPKTTATPQPGAGASDLDPTPPITTSIDQPSRGPSGGPSSGPSSEPEPPPSDTPVPTVAPEPPETSDLQQTPAESNSRPESTSREAGDVPSPTSAGTPPTSADPGSPLPAEPPATQPNTQSNVPFTPVLLSSTGTSSINMGGIIYSALGGSSASSVKNDPSLVQSASEVGTDGEPAPETYQVGGQTFSAGGPGATASGTTYSALPSGAGVIAAASGSTATYSSLSSATAVQGSLAVDAHELDDGQTMSAGGPGASLSGTTFSVLPSGAGVIAAARGSTTTYSSPSGESLAANAYELGDGQTISAGGARALLSGTTFSALPSGAGVIAAAAGSTTTLSDSAVTVVASDSNPVIALSTPDQYELGNGQTITAGGPAANFSGTTLSALPSGSGVVAVADGQTTTIVSFQGDATPVNVTDEGSGAFILPNGETITVGGAAATIGGDVYSALTSGVVVGVSGQSTTLSGSDLRPASTETGTAGMPAYTGRASHLLRPQAVLMALGFLVLLIMIIA